MLDFARRLTIPSAALYMEWRVRRRQTPVTLRLRSGPKLELRSNAVSRNDYGTAYEIFVHDFYNDGGRLSTGSVKLVVDLGANVGYSALYFLHKYPNCRVIAFEPHPAFAAQAERNFRLNDSTSRVELYVKAAGAHARPLRLMDRLSGSILTHADTPDTFPVEVVDFFPIVNGKRIDLLKIDIEGSEYEIMGDERFALLNIGAIVMEWHSRGGGLEDKRWCEQRLSALGFIIKDVFTRPTHGMFWAVRQ